MDQNIQKYENIILMGDMMLRSLKQCLYEEMKTYMDSIIFNVVSEKVLVHNSAL